MAESTAPRRNDLTASLGRPILVMMVYRGGARFQRALTSLVPALDCFHRVILSVTSAEDSEDLATARRFAAQHPGVEVLCTGQELPTMAHQAFWIDHLEKTGVRPEDWILWLAYDDELRVRGIRSIVDDQGNWPLHAGTAYFGPWAMRHEQADVLWHGDPAEPLDSWTSFPLDGPLRTCVIDWIGAQLYQPTYMQMSGSVCTFDSHRSLVRGVLRKGGPMRIEMATAAALNTRFVEEFPEPISIIYGRPNSDRASYGRAARREDWHLLIHLLGYLFRHPGQLPTAMRWAWRFARRSGGRGRGGAISEAWVRRTQVQP